MAVATPPAYYAGDRVLHLDDDCEVRVYKAIRIRNPFKGAPHRVELLNEATGITKWADAHDCERA